MILSDVRTIMRDILNEPVASKWTDAQLNLMINHGERDTAIKTGCYEGIQVLYTKAHSRIVPFAGYRVKDVEYIPASGTNIGLQRIPPKAVGHATVDGITPQFWFQWGDNIIIEPMPTVAYTLWAYVAQWPDYEMSDDADQPFIPTEFQTLLSVFGLFHAYLKVKKFGTSGLNYQKYTAVAKVLARSLKREKDLEADLQIPDVVKIITERGA